LPPDVWDTGSWQLVRSLPAGQADDLAVSPDDHALAVVDSDTAHLSLWDVRDGRRSPARWHSGCLC